MSGWPITISADLAERIAGVIHEQYRDVALRLALGMWHGEGGTRARTEAEEKRLRALYDELCDARWKARKEQNPICHLTSPAS